MAERKSTEADDVFEFLESLPQTGKGASSTSEKGGKQKGKNDDDIMEFLDELEKSNLSLNKKGHSVDNQRNGTSEAVEAKVTEEAAEPESKQEKEKVVEEPLNDPITSLSNWWSSSGSATVSNFWSKTTEQATSIKTRLAQDQLDLSSKLNAATITDLARNLQKMVAGETDEVLRIHLVHDLVDFPQLQYNVEQKFDQVLSSQVQGGIRIFVDQWGHPHKPVAGANDEVQKSAPSTRKLNLFSGKIADGEKLAFANLDNAIKLFDKAHEEYMRQQKESQTHETDEQSSQEGISDIFISILPIAIPGNDKRAVGDIPTTDSVHPGNFSFTVILKDISNDISTITRSQGFPMKWVAWLEGDAATAEDEEEVVDPSDWVKEWVEDGLSLTLGVAAQNYVIERMGF